MESPLDDYNYLKKEKGIEDNAKYELFDKYLKLNLKNFDKITELDSIDQEGLMIKVNGGLPLPGFMYTFVYKSKILDVLKNKNTVYSFVDYTPIVFAFSVSPESFAGINFNLLPPLERVKFLQIYYKTYEKFWNEETSRDKLTLNEDFIKSVKGGNGQKIINIFDRQTNSNFNFAYRQYAFKSMQNIRMIEYNEWKYLPFFNPKNSIKNLSFDIIYKLYYKSKSNG